MAEALVITGHGPTWDFKYCRLPSCGEVWPCEATKAVIRESVRAMKEGRTMPADTFFEWMQAKYVRDIWEQKSAEARAENARLQARVEEEKGITDTAIRAMETAERERDGYKALAELRGAILKAAYDLINYREHAFYEPAVPLDTYLYQLHNWLDWALPAIDATPEEAGRRRSHDVP